MDYGRRDKRAEKLALKRSPGVLGEYTLVPGCGVLNICALEGR